MANIVVISGNLARDPMVSQSTGEKSTCTARFSVGVQRDFKNAEGRYDADFPNVVAFGNTAEFVNKYFHKGDRIEVIGQIRTGSYTNKDGVKVYTTDVYADKVKFGGGKNDGDNTATASVPSQPRRQQNLDVNVPGNVDEELPFN